jgi:DNA-binding NarL/FixJ family response regulator
VGPASSSVLIVADPNRVGELTSALAEPLPQGEIEVLVSSGGDDTIDLFHARMPPVVVITASLEMGDATSLIDTLRGMVPRANVAFVVIGDDTGPIRTPLDAMEMAPDRFVTRPLDGKAVRFAVQSSLEAVALRTTRPNVAPRTMTQQGTGVAIAIDDDPTMARAAMRARWEALADSIGIDEPDGITEESSDEAVPLPPPIQIHPRGDHADVAPMTAWRPGSTDVPAREPTLIIRGPDSTAPSPAPDMSEIEPTRPRVDSVELERRRPTKSDPPQNLVMTERGGDDPWSEPIPLAELIDRTGDRIERISLDEEGPGLDDFADELMVGRGMSTPPPGRSTPPPLDDFADEFIARRGMSTPPPPHVVDDADFDDPDVIVPTPLPAPLPDPPLPERGGRDFARQLREKMSMMAQRLFAGDSQSSQGVDMRPRHDHHTEIDLATLGEETPLNNSVTEIERGIVFADARELTTSPGSWDTQVRERGLPDSGEIVRGVSDASLLLAKLFAQNTTGRIGFRRDEIEKVVHFDQGRPVWASSNEPGDRMGELLVREGKITLSQYERCQTQVAQSGRRMGEILVDFGYLKRRELLPAVRRHVEDIVYSLFGWDHGHYLITIDTAASVERIRMSRHPAALILEGVRRKLDRKTLERLVGPASTVIEVRDKVRLGGIINTADLAAEERSALGAFDAQADLAAVARTAGVDTADILPLAWGLVVLGLAIARRADAGLEESTALVGETDLAIDRERVRARWELVTEADYFALLGVRRDATGFEIRRAYQSARRDFASDCFPVDLRRELARELDDIATVLDEAFRVLRDDRLRVTYLSNLVD